MPKYSIAIARMAVSGSHRQEVTDALLHWENQFHTDPWYANNLDLPSCRHFKINYCPTDAARNRAVRRALDLKMDYLVMLDDDSAPHFDFLRSSLAFMIDYSKPCVVGAAYVTGGNSIPVMRLVANGEYGFKPERFTTAELAHSKGIQEVHDVGSHNIIYDLRAFGLIKLPWFEYEFSDEFHSDVVATEECVCNQKLARAGVKIFCNFNTFSDHFKTHRYTKPIQLTRAHIDQFYLDQAKAVQ